MKKYNGTPQLSSAHSSFVQCRIGASSRGCAHQAFFRFLHHTTFESDTFFASTTMIKVYTDTTPEMDYIDHSYSHRYGA
jgi:hypothetical protein